MHTASRASGIGAGLPAPADDPRPADGIPPGAVSLAALLGRAAEAVRAGVPEPVWTVAAVVAVRPARGGWSLELAGAEDAGAVQLRAYLADGVVMALRRSAGRTVDPTLLAGVTVVLRLGLELHPRWGVSGRVAALAPGVEASLAARALEAARARLAAEGLLDRQRRRPAPADVTRLAVVHPPEAAGWGDVAAELRRWTAAGVVALRPVPTPFEGEAAPAALAAAVVRASEAIDGGLPDLVMVVRGGGARAALAALDDEALARAIARAPVPILTGLGHARDRTLADEAAWRAADTPSKALALVRDLVVRPARRARADHAAVLAAALSGLDRVGPVLDATLSRGLAAAQRRVAVSAEEFGTAWAGALGGIRAAREGLGRRADGLDALVATAAAAASARVEGADAALEQRGLEVRARARTAIAAAPDGGHLLAVAVAWARARHGAADPRLEAFHREVAGGARWHLGRAEADLVHLGEAVRARARDRVARADDGTRHRATAARAAAAACGPHKTAVAQLIEAVEAATARRLDAAMAALATAQAVLDGADPERVLARGYALVLDAAGRPLTSARAAWACNSLILHFADGDLAARTIPG